MEKLKIIDAKKHFYSFKPQYAPWYNITTTSKLIDTEKILATEIEKYVISLVKDFETDYQKAIDNLKKDNYQKLYNINHFKRNFELLQQLL